MAYPGGQGLTSMAPARLPGPPAAGLMQVGPPHFGPDAPPADDAPIGEDAKASLEKLEGLSKLIGQFENELSLADNARQAKEWKWIKIEKYLMGKDAQDPPEGYEESTFFYRRLPRIVQIGRAKLFKQVWPIHGRPWDVRPSPRRDPREMDFTEEKRRLSKLKEEFDDIHEANELENGMDEMCGTLSALGSMVTIGPVQLRQPTLRWMDGDEELEPGDELKPGWEFIDPKRVYPDPNSRNQQGLEYVHIHYVLSPHQIRSLVDDSTFINEELADLLVDLPDGNWAGNLRRWEVYPFPTNISNAMLNRYIVWRRIGVLTADAMEDLGEDVRSQNKNLKDWKNLDKAQRRALTDSLWEVWWCGKHIIKISKRKFQPKKMYVHFVPFRSDPGSIFGIGAGESGLEVCEMLINICRSIDDALADTSGFQAMIDAGSIENKDLRVRGRKTWLWRDKGVGKKVGAQGRPIEFFTVPSNLDKLLEAAKYFESLIPVVTGFIEMAKGADMGSGIRTDDMMEKVWDSLEEFIRDVVGNVDRYWWKPHLRDMHNWIKTYYPDYESNFKVEANLQVQGVRGALKREIVGRKMKDLFKELHQYGLPDWFDEVEAMTAIFEGMGMEEEKGVLNPKQYVERQALKMKQKEMEAEAGNAPQGKERSEIATRDGQLKAYAGIPDSAETVKLLTFKELAKSLKMLSPELEKAIDATVPMAVARDGANHMEKAPKTFSIRKNPDGSIAATVDGGDKR
jgi:hypothetical protein